VVSMTSRLSAIAALLLLANCGVYGPKGNDTGGIIPWSPEAQHDALEIAQANCGSYGKYAVITSVDRHPGQYIAYACDWKQPHTRYRR
jgi:hypothetical protein